MKMMKIGAALIAAITLLHLISCVAPNSGVRKIQIDGKVLKCRILSREQSIIVKSHDRSDVVNESESSIDHERQDVKRNVTKSEKESSDKTQIGGETVENAENEK